ncbi:MAG: tyrosine--tRNA ligase [Acidimicrobiia bacterium]|nr:tyrosine--tRNA ligase [Acidimicrobiia bacterium]
MTTFLPVDEQIAYLTDGVDTMLPEGALRELLEEGRPLRVKLGVDPTAPDVTLGWAVVFRLLRRFQEMGHTAVLIVGDFTAQVGDPSGKSETRKRLDSAEVESYVSETLDTIKELLMPERLEIRPNTEWLAKMDMQDVLSMTAAVTVARIMDRDDFSKRWELHEPISLIEFMYPLLQAMDSVAVEADIEIGGTDQLFNLLVGRDLQQHHGQKPQAVVTVPLLVGTDGEKKMSQSLGNYVSVKDTPEEMFGKTMSIPDHLMEQWFVLAAAYRTDAAAEVAAEIASGERHPGDTKRLLAREVVALYWGKEAAVAAEAAFDQIFKAKEAPDEMPEVVLDGQAEVFLPALLDNAGVVASRSEARRLIKQGAVKIDGVKVVVESVDAADVVGKVIQVGKRRFVRAVS